MKSSFVIYTDYLEQTSMLSDEQMGILFRSVLQYAASGTIGEMDSLTQLAFNFIKVKLDRDAEKYAEVVEKRREAGRQGGLAKASKASKSKQNVANLADNENENDNVNENDIPKDGNSNRRFTPPTVDQVRGYCAEKGYNVDAESFVDFYESKGWMVGKNKMKDWKAAVRGWSTRNKSGKQTNFHNFKPRDGTDYGEIERQLILKSIKN